MHSVGKAIDKFFTDRMVILHQRKMVVGQTLKCCSEHKFFLLENSNMV
jgi:hypothetical protein